MRLAQLGERAVVFTADCCCALAIKQHADLAEVRPVYQVLRPMTMVVLVEEWVRIQMVRLDRHRKLSFADEVHVGLVLVLIVVMVPSTLVASLPVEPCVVFLLKIDQIRTCEDTLKLDDEHRDALIGFFDHLRLDTMPGQRTRQKFPFFFKMRVFERLKDPVLMDKFFKRFFGHFALVNG